MRNLGIVALCATLIGCGVTVQEASQRIGAYYIGKSSDLLVKDFGPPGSTYKLQSGDLSMIWQLDAVTPVAKSDYAARAQTEYCKVSVITDPRGIVTDLRTEDSDTIMGGSICAQRLGMIFSNR